MRAILSILVENRPGILWKVTHLFRARNFNIESISVGVTQNPELSRMTITTLGSERQIAQIVKQLDKMIDTIQVKWLDSSRTVSQELALFKFRADGEGISRIKDLARARGATVRESSEGHVTVELAASPEDIMGFAGAADEMGLVEIARTGLTALEAF